MEKTNDSAGTGDSAVEVNQKRHIPRVETRGTGDGRMARENEGYRKKSRDAEEGDYATL